MRTLNSEADKAADKTTSKRWMETRQAEDAIADTARSWSLRALCRLTKAELAYVDQHLKKPKPDASDPAGSSAAAGAEEASGRRSAGPPAEESA